MIKKAGIVIFLFTNLVSQAFSSNPVKSLEEIWVDSVYQTLSDEQRLGQLIVSKKSNPEIVKLIEDGELPIGGIFLQPSNVLESNETILHVKNNMKGLFWVFAESNHQLERMASDFYAFPNDVTKASIRNKYFVEDLEKKEAASLRNLGTSIYYQKEVYLDNINGEYFHHLLPSQLYRDTQEELIGMKNKSLRSEDILMAINLNLTFDDYDFVKYIPEDIYSTTDWDNIKHEYPILFLDNLKFKNGWESDEFKKEIVRNLIRKKFDFEGVLAIDLEKFKAQHFKPLKRNSTESELIKSGVDFILTDNPVRAYQVMLSELKNNEIRNGDLENRVKQVLKYKYLQRASLEENPSQLADQYIRPSEVKNSIYESYAESITLVRNESDLIPIRNLETTNFASLSIGASELTKFQETLDKYAGFTHFVLPSNQINANAFNNLVKTLSSFDNVVVGLHAPFNKDMLSLLASLEFKTNVIATLFDENIPDNLESVTNSLLVTYESNDYVQELAPQIIFGARPCVGMYPDLANGGDFKSIQTRALSRLAYANSFKSAMDEDILKGIDDIALEAVNGGATPGCQILVARNGNVVYEKSFGNYTYDTLMPVSNRSMYDLASITKVAATTQAIMFLANRGVLDLDQKLGHYLPELKGTNKEDLIIRDILTHQSGLKGFLPLWVNTIDFENIQVPFYSNEKQGEYQLEVGFGMYSSLAIKDSIYKWTVDSELRRKPRRKRFEPYSYRYSDLGFYMMYVLAERLLNQPMDEFLSQNLYDPLGMSSTAFNPLCKFPIINMVPTEDDKTFRHSLVWGTVHDQIAAMNGGVSGHAGLFGNAIDLAKLGQMHLQGGEYGNQKFFDKEVIDLFTSPQNEDNRRGLGWDKPDPEDKEHTPTSVYASPSTYGHRGFTGTVIWVDPQYDLIYVFLSNRIYPSMSNGKLNDLDVRKRIHDVVYESITNFEASVN